MSKITYKYKKIEPKKKEEVEKSTSSNYIYKKGTKLIEIEGKKYPEIHTDKNFNIKNLGTNPHYKGGTKVIATEGDVVFPTQNSQRKYKKISKAIQEGDKKTLIKERDKLPDDKSSKTISKHPNGLGGLSLPKASPSELSPNLGQPEGTLNTSNLLNFNQGSSNPNSAPSGLGSLGSASIGSGGKYGEIATNLLNYSPAIYNTLSGVFEKPVKTNRRFYTPEEQQYQGISNPLRQASKTDLRADLNNVKAIAGQNASSFLANSQEASNRDFNRRQGIENNESARRLDIVNYNRDLRNQAKGTNLGLANQYDELDLMNKAAKRNFMTTGMSQSSAINQNNQLMGNMKSSDQIRANMLDTGDFYYNSDNQKVSSRLRNYNKGSKSIRTYKMKKKS